ncbi:MAG: DNA primase [bacterium]
MDLFGFVKSSLSVLDVISEYVTLRPMGSYYKGSCPFHAETDASFTVSPDKQIFYCFGCQASGDVIGFIAKIENVSQIESARHLIDQYNLQIPDYIDQNKLSGNKSAEVKEAYYAVHEQVTLWAHDQLLQNKEALGYLTDRGLSLQQIKEFEVGYFPSGQRNLNNFAKAMAAQNLMLKDLLECHIVMDSKMLYSPFEERILFPIADHLGRYCGFGGRIFRKEDERAKYYNSKESDFFSKGKLLFGFDKAKKSIQKNENAFLVEGYMDCLAMVQYGYTNTVATLGTACTIDHLKTLARHAKILYFLYDGDKAGRAAILRIAQLCWQVDIELNVLLLPGGQDPDTFLNGKGDLSVLMQQSQDIFSFYIVSMVGADFLQQSLSVKLGVAKKVVGLVASLSDAFKQDLLLHQAASAMQMPFETVKGLLMSQSRSEFVKKTMYGAHVQAGDSNQESQDFDAYGVGGEEKGQKWLENASILEEKIFSVILNAILKTGDILEIESDLVPCFSPGIQRLLEKLYALVKTGTKSSEFFTVYMSSLNDDEKQIVSRVSIKYDVPVNKEEFDQLVVCFCKHNWKNIVQVIRQDISKAKQENDQAALSELFGRFSRLKQKFLSKGLV